MAILPNRNIVQKVAEKKLNYVSLCMEMQRMWNLKSKIQPVKVRVTGILRKGILKKFGSHTRKTFNSLTTTDSFLGTSHVIRKGLRSET